MSLKHKLRIARPGQDGPVCHCHCVGMCLLTEQDKLQQDLAKMDQFVSVLVCVCWQSGTSCSKTWPRWTSLSVCWCVCVDRAGQAAARPGQDGPVCQCVGVCVLTERDKLQQDLAKMDQFVSVLVCVCWQSGTSCSKTWPRWTSLSVCWCVCVDRAGQAAARPGQDGPVWGEAAGGASHSESEGCRNGEGTGCVQWPWETASWCRGEEKGDSHGSIPVRG